MIITTVIACCPANVSLSAASASPWVPFMWLYIVGIVLCIALLVGTAVLYINLELPCSSYRSVCTAGTLF